MPLYRMQFALLVRSHLAYRSGNERLSWEILIEWAAVGGDPRDAEWLQR